MTAVRPAEPADVEGCVEVLRRLPDHFTADTYDRARAGLAEHRAWVATSDGDLVGFVLVERRFPRSAEITFAAVRPDRQGAGVGTALVEHALGVLADEGVSVVEVKTLDGSSGYEPYVATRAFWEHRGFHQIDCIDPLPGWKSGNPCALYVAALRRVDGS